MIPLAAPALAGLLLLVGLAALLASRQQRAVAGALDARVERAVGARAPGRGDERSADRENWQGTLDARLRGLFSYGLDRMWGVTASGGGLLVAGSAAGTLGWLAVRLASAAPPAVAAIVGMAGFYLLPRLIVRRQQKKAEALFAERFPDVIDMVVRMIRAGLPAVAAVRTTGQEAMPPVNRVFIQIADETEIGIPFETALTRTAGRIGLPDFRFFAVAISLQRSTGGNLTATLEALSEIIRRRRAVRLKAKAATAEVRMSAYILAAIPVLVIGALSLLQPGYLTPLFTDPRGNVILGAAVLCLVLAWWTMRSMIRSGTEI